MTSFHRTEHTIIWTRYVYDLLFLNDEICLARLLYENMRFRPNLSKKQDESSQRIDIVYARSCTEVRKVNTFHFKQSGSNLPI